ELGQFEAVHVRHLHVDEGQRHIVVQQQLEGFRTGTGLEYGQCIAAQQRLEGDQVLLQIIDQQKIYVVILVTVHVLITSDSCRDSGQWRWVSAPGHRGSVSAPREAWWQKRLSPVPAR